MTKSYEGLLKDMTEIIAQIRERAYAKGYEQGKFDQRMETSFEDVKKVVKEWEDDAKPPTMSEIVDFGRKHVRKSSQQSRDRIVERAKGDIEGLKEVWYVPGTPMRYIRNILVLDEEFIVNKKKRTIVCLLRHIHGTVYRGIAKCAPNDCFNVHIGKAIALRRALGLEVPSEYLEAPQPTEVRIGDIVNYKGYEVKIYGREEKQLMDYTLGTCQIGSMCADEGKITDDSREGE